MSFTTTANNTTVTEEATLPSLSLLQMDAADIGRLQNSVNMFLGDVLLPIQLVSLRSRGNLSAAVVLNYSSNVRDEVDTWNVEAPTGVAGVGWSLRYDLIMLDYAGSVAPETGLYYLGGSDGSKTRLYCTERTATQWSFEAENYQFQRITYDPVADAWQVAGNDGITRIYGATPGSRQQALKWGGSTGNWSDSTRFAGASVFSNAWNLTAIRNQWGDAITFDYLKDDVPIGDTGATYTRSCYISRIADGTGRTITFTYQDKLYTDSVREYQPPSTPYGGSGPHVAQNRFQTRYLDTIAVAQEIDGVATPVTQYRLLYRIANYTTAPGNPVYLMKRYLTGISAVLPTGELEPALQFDYYTGEESLPPERIHRGALAQVTYASGATTRYDYERGTMNGTSLDRTLSRADIGPGKPRVWFGPTYTVVLCYSETQGPLMTLNVYDWNGSWVGSQPVQASLPGTLDLSTLNVVTQSDWFLLSFRLTNTRSGGDQIITYAVSRKYGRFADWEAVQLPMPTLRTADSAFEVTAGRSFIAAAASDVRQLYRYAWDPRTRTWLSAHLDLSDGGEFVLASTDTALTVCQYVPGPNRAVLTLFLLAEDAQAWNDGLQLDTIGPILWQKDLPKLSWSLSGCFAAATYLQSRADSTKTVTYAVSVYQWDSTGATVTAAFTQAYTNIPMSTELPFFYSASVGSLVGNVNNLWRFNGQSWSPGTMGQFAGDKIIHFTYGQDLAIGTDSQQSQIWAYDPYGDTYELLESVVSSQGPMQPTVTGQYLTVRNTLLYRDPDGQLRSLGMLDPDTVDVANAAPLYFGYQLPDNSAYLYLIQNGELNPETRKLDSQLFATIKGPGTVLAGQGSLATYAGDSLDNATTITLYRVLHQQIRGAIADFRVSALQIADGLGGVYDTAYRYPGNGTTGPYGLASQYTAVEVSPGPADGLLGYSRCSYLDGLAPGLDTPGPYTALNGLLQAKEVYDSRGQLVAVERYNWEVAQAISDLQQAGRTLQLIGGYPRAISSSTTTYDPAARLSLTATSSYTYDDAVGQPATRTTTNYQPDGTAISQVEAYTYGYVHYPDMVAANLLAPVVQTQLTVGSETVRLQATTWQRWGDTQAWAPVRQLRARTADATLSPADWSGATLPDIAAWWVTQAIQSRDAFGNTTQELGPDGVPTSHLFEARGRFPVASVRGAARDQGQFTYLSFAPYEQLQGWTLAGSGATLRSQIVSGDGNPGAWHVPVTAEPGSGPLACTLQVLAPAGERYLFTCWVKNAPGSLPDAAWQLTVGDTATTLHVPDTRGEWTQIFAYLEIPAAAAAQPVTLSLANQSPAAVAVGGLSFAPVTAAVSAQVYDPLHQRQTAQVARTGAVTRTLYTATNDVSAQVDALGAATTVHAHYRSRQGNLGRFAAADPNSRLVLRPQSWSCHQRFSIGAQWQANWAADSWERWSTAHDALLHQAGAASTLSYTAVPAGTSCFGLQVRAIARGPLTAPLGFVLGEHLRVTWSPALAAWQLIADGQTVTAPPRLLTTVDFATDAPSLNDGRLPPDLPARFAAAGLPLAPNSRVTPVAASARWIIQDGGSTAIYYLVRSSTAADQINVAIAPVTWTLLVDGRDLVLFADGGRVLSWHSSSPITGAPGITAADAVAFDNLVLFADCQLELAYQDGTDQTRQRQVKDTEGPVANANFPDSMGRMAVSSLTARLTPAPAQLLAYEPNLAQFDWATLAMTGLVQLQNPDSGSYPYSRTRYEDSPLGRTVELGLPGADFAIRPDGGGHTNRISYGINNGQFSTAPGKFTTKTNLDPDGVTHIALTDLNEKVVVTATLSATTPEVQYEVTHQHYDGAGRVTEVQHPTGITDSFSYNFLGQLMRSTYADERTTRFCYDQSGRLRCEQTANGSGSTPYIRYWKYDRLGRAVEQGCYETAWQGLRPADPVWPTATPSEFLIYDALDARDLLGLGRLVRSVNQNQVSSPGQSDGFTAQESFAYDLNGRTVTTAVQVDSFREAAYQIHYTYDVAGNVTRVTYPAWDGASGRTAAYRYDPVGRIRDLRVDGVPYAAYTYGINGRPAVETLQQGSTTLGSRSYTWSPQGWLLELHDPILRESVAYTSGGIDGAGYFNGSPAAITTQARGTAPLTVRRFAYDTAGRLRAAVADSPGADSFRYDGNGNLLQAGSAAFTRSPSNDQLLTRTQGSVTEQYSYDPSGNLTSRASSDPGLNLSLGFDWWSGRFLGGSGGPDTARVGFAFRYGTQGRRLLRTVTLPGQAPATKLYVRGLRGEPLAEFGASPEESTLYIQGPNGMALMFAGAAATAPLFLSRDYLGSVRGVMDAAGALVAGYDYDAWGNDLRPPFGSNPEITRYRFVNRELDVCGLYNFLARAYDPRTGAFISPDPRHQFASPYVYVGNNPLVLTDPDGEFAFLALLIAALIGAAVGGVTASVAAGVTIAHNHLRGGKAAGVFFGFLGLGITAGALAGVAGPLGVEVATAVGAGMATATATGIATGAVGGAVAGAAQSAGQTALLGGDVGHETGVGALVGAISGGLGTVAGKIGEVVEESAASLAANAGVRAARAALNRGMPRAMYNQARDAVEGVTKVGITYSYAFATQAVVNVSTSTLATALDHGSGSDYLLSALQGLAFGTISAYGDRFQAAVTAHQQPQPRPTQLVLVQPHP